MNRQVAIVVAVLLILAAGAWALSERLRSQRIDPIVGQQFGWGFIDLGVSTSTQAPTTNVELKIAGIEVPVGTYTGTCFILDGVRWKLLPGELTGAVCDWQNAGKEIGIFDENGALVLKEGVVAEGPTGEPISREGFVPLKKLQ